jgi:hypothetical protein
MEQREKIVVANQASTTAAKSHGRKLLRGEQRQATAHEENLSTVSKIQSSCPYSRRKQILFLACSSRYRIESSSVKKSAVKFKV